MSNTPEVMYLTDKKQRQREIVDFLTPEEQRLLSPEEQKKRKSAYARKKARSHFEEAIQYLLKSVDKNSIDYVKILNFVKRTVIEMEKKDMCFFRAMPNGRTRIFKIVYCCRELEHWKKCPEYKCVAMPCYDGHYWDCPLFEKETEGMPIMVDAVPVK